MKASLPIKSYSRVPWLIASCALLSSVANLATGIVILATNVTAGDVALGILTLVFAIWGLVGSILALYYIVKQNRFNRSQASFIAQVSHELRTPLTSVRMYADTLKGKRFKTPEEENELFEYMCNEISRLESLTIQILESKNKKVSRPEHAIPLAPVLIEVLQPFLEHPKYANRIVIAFDEPIADVYVDPEDFRNAASNLILNALTHGGDGEVEVELHSVDDRTELYVRDHGKGISAKMLKKIFEPFERGASTTDSGIPGFGLGLSIVRDFARKTGAKLNVTNPPDGGAAFTISMKSA